MDNVIIFPAKSVRDRAEIERSLRDALRTAGASQGLENAVLSNMDEFLQLLNLEFRISVPTGSVPALNSQIDALSLALKERTNRLILERLHSEIHHCHALGVF